MLYLMLHLVRLSPLFYLSILYFPFTAAGDHEAPANPKTDSLQLFSAAAEIWQKLLGETCLTFFQNFITCGKTWKILNKHKERHWSLYSLFLFNFINKMRFLIGMFLCFALVPKLVQRTVDFHWYWYRILKFWYRDNTTACYIITSQPLELWQH